MKNIIGVDRGRVLIKKGGRMMFENSIRSKILMFLSCMNTSLILYLFLSASLFAQELIEIHPPKDLLKKGEKPAMSIIPNLPLKSITIELNREDGKQFKGEFSKTSKRQRRIFTWEQEEGTFEYGGVVIGYDANDTPIEYPFNFKVSVIGSFKMTVPLERVNSFEKSCIIQLSAPVEELNIRFIGPDALSVGRIKTGLLDGPIEIPVSWAEIKEDVLRIDIDATDRFGNRQEFHIFPWCYIVPHEEVVFDTGKDLIREDQEYKLQNSYDHIMKVVNKYGKIVKVELYICGYTDTVDDRAYNLDLSMRRARSIAAYFKKLGFPYPIYYQGFGEDVLAVPTADGVDEEKNRRALYILSSAPPPVSADIPRSDWKKLQ